VPSITTNQPLTNETLTRKIAAILLASVIFLAAAPTTTTSAAPSAAPLADEKRISVYSPVAFYALPVVERGGREYVGLLELLEPLGRVSSESDPHRWKLRYNAIEAEFVAGKTRGRIHGRDFDLPAPFLMENSRGLVPLSSLGTLLPRFLGAPVNFRESARRLFVGDVGTQISFQLVPGTPPRLMLNFSAAVNPTISTEPGRLRMVFKRDPVLSPGSQSISFDNKIITQANYTENNGDAELDVAASQPLMASFSNNRRTIIVAAITQPAGSRQTAANAPAPATPQNPAPSSSGPSSSSPSPSAPPSAPSPSPEAIPPKSAGSNNNTNNDVHRILAVVDPAHGGDERGAALTDKLAEKDVTLGFARLLRHELEIRGFAVTLLRDADTASTLDQRAASANGARAEIYISLHAASRGAGARVYTALLPVEGTNNGPFRAWNAVQAPALPLSRIVSAAIVTEFQKKQFPAAESSASLRPLNNVFMPAVAVELAPGSNGVADLTNANYQQRAASAIADAVVSVRDRLGAQVGAQP
jgi:N-acetylmuramoyl-L-alanine amidase